MQINKNFENVISLKSIFVHIFYHWRSILISAVIGGLLLCGYQYLTNNKSNPKVSVTTESNSAQKEIDRYTKLLESQTAYQNESVYYQLNPQAVWTATNTYLITVDPSVLEAFPAGSTADPVDYILTAYTAPLSGLQDGQGLKEVFGTESLDYASELVGGHIDIDTNTVDITVKGGNREDAQKGSDYLHTRIMEISKGEPQTIYPHNITRIKQEIGITVDDTLAKKQTNLAKSIEENKKNLQSAQNNLTAEGKATGLSRKSNLVKMGLIGLLLGAFLAVCFYACQYIFNRKLKDSKELSDKYNLPILGEITHSEARKPGHGIDKLIEKWAEVKNSQEKAKVYDSIVALIREHKTGNILLTGTISKEDLDLTFSELKTRLDEKQTIIAVGDLLNNATALTEASQASAVILVEKMNASRQADIQREAEMMIIAKAEVIGAIVL